uniref:Intraflagellar transport associated protein n=1 Tax=Otolemur garnettii TaxID=30611 RepID=H0X5R2_OTOGA
MPAPVSGLERMDKDRLIEEVLDRFVNCHEQTYEEFLSTFTHLSKEYDVTKSGAFGSDSSEKIFTSRKSTHKNEPNDHHVRNKTIFLHTSSQCSEEEQIDNFLDLEDLDVDEELQPQTCKEMLLLPGEAEQSISPCISSYHPSVDRRLTGEVKPESTGKGAARQMEEVPGDEVQPFSLDEEFDYDSVVLTPKFSLAEIETLKELSARKRKDSNADLAEPLD